MEARQQTVKEIIKENRYLNLATTDGEEPWVAPVEYVVDDELNFYFQSLETSRHIRHIQTNAKVGVSIYNSQQPSMTGRGVQFEGSVEVYDGEQHPAVLYDDRFESAEAVPDMDPRYSIYTIKPHRFYLPESYLEEDGIDRRIEVDWGKDSVAHVEKRDLSDNWAHVHANALDPRLQSVRRHSGSISASFRIFRSHLHLSVGSVATAYSGQSISTRSFTPSATTGT